MYSDQAVALDILDNAAIEAFFSQAEPFDHVAIAAAATKSGPVARLPLDDAKPKIVSHGYVAFQVAEVAIPRTLLCRRPAADRGVAAATRYIDSVMRSVSRSTKNHGRRAS
jgi:hypothetical protein